LQIAKGFFNFLSVLLLQDFLLIPENILTLISPMELILSDTLGTLINKYEKAVNEYPEDVVEDFDGLINALKASSIIRNVICHASWRNLPDSKGASKPFFVNKKREIFDTEVDSDYLNQVQRHVAELACEVINTITHMGWQFPGSNGPGEKIWSH
jgi:hypothetical protein